MYIKVGKHVELSDNHSCKPTQFLVDDTLSLPRVTPEGVFSWLVFQPVYTDGDGGFHVQPRAFAGESIPEGFGGVLAAWTWVDSHKQPSDPLNVHIEARLTRLSDSGQRDFTLPMPFWTKGISSFFAENMVLAEETNSTPSTAHSSSASTISSIQSETERQKVNQDKACNVICAMAVRNNNSPATGRSL